MIRHFLDIQDYSKDEIIALLDHALVLKKELKANITHEQVLLGKTVALLFEKPSTRTRVSFEVGVKQLGGDVVVLQKDEVGLGKREAIKDVARVLSRYVDMVMIRTFDHEHLKELASWVTIPVMNGLTNWSHPCQALADLVTIKEAFGTLEGLKVCYLGDGNNVARSLVEIGGLCGIDVVLSTPESARLEPSGAYVYEKEALVAVKDADVVYTDAWVSMGETHKNLDRFMPYQVNSELMGVANKDAIILHCLPAHRGEEVTDGVLESVQSRVFDQAENRLYAQQAIMSYLI